ncbi:hypothetical protein OTU49_000116 [Cherax quadricarinatus]|uniref:Fibrinogen C-terminal domain-containing protein n=1 Tax=Cherax quadricarinatus TaxID=27406 RepID=A0AAW0Y2H2_CHEQU|nr:ficolin-2-like [Cherax quadricarinatus]XP_053633819.1 ficolin-2-like [Cherax quadricarinatus]XP_053633820.1 ficolin-2-like [Cherax quadricarinatus]XP_053633821.1 ficolin-2-like [Cherax quadricarinatus]
MMAWVYVSWLLIMEAMAAHASTSTNFEEIKYPDSRLREDLQQLSDGLTEDNQYYSSLVHSRSLYDQQLSIAADCADHLMGGAITSGVYYIYPFTCSCRKPVPVWCDMETDGGGWTVFLTRQTQDSQVDFNRWWQEYKSGFGDPHGEYWLGNEHLHQMTSSRSYSVRVDFTSDAGVSYYLYRTFIKVASEAERYGLSLGAVASYNTSTGCFATSGSPSFSTKDQDYDSATGNCAVTKGGGWWYYNCLYNNPTSPYNSGLSFTCYPKRVIKLSKLQVKIRPTAFNSSLCRSCYQ